jgi:hypothetical protein
MLILLDIEHIWIGAMGSSMVENLFKTKTSFGKYFDDQRDRIVKAMQNKNAQLWQEWRENFDKRQKDLALLQKMKPASAREQEIVKQMIIEQLN